MEDIKPSENSSRDASLPARRKALEAKFEAIDKGIALHGKIPPEDHYSRIKNKQQLNKLIEEASRDLDEFGRELEKQASKVKTPEQKQILEKHTDWCQLQGNELLNRVGKVRQVCEGIATDASGSMGGGLSSSSGGKSGRKGRHQKSNRLKSINDIELDNLGGVDTGPASAQEQAFMEEMAQKWKEEDQMLEEISQALSGLLVLAQRINAKLKQISYSIENVEMKMDKVQERLDNANERMEKMLEESGGLTRWCPICICIVLVLACVAFIYTKTK